jgi:beta-glucosidase
MGVAFVRGLQGEDSEYLKLVATPKHYAVHSGPEPLRHGFDALASPKDLRETYLPHFKECVQEGGAWSIMGAYNRTNGEACCASPTLLQKILREEWGFQGYVVSDCGAIQDIHAHHKVTKDAAEAAALAVNNGCDLNCGQTYHALVEAVERGLISEETIDRSVKRLMEARFKLGMFDPEDRVPYSQIPYKIVDCGKHREHSLDAARQSLVLLKNQRVLPIAEAVKTVAVVGPLAHDRDVLVGNYNGTPCNPVTLLDGVRARAGKDVRVLYARGCPILDRHTRWGEAGDDGFSEAEAAVDRADLAIVALGLTANLEGEEGSAEWADAGGDRPRIDLPDIQQRFLKRILAVGKPVILVLFSGSPLSVPWEQENAAAILQAWYPGGEGGQAVAEVLFGDYSPAGRMPVTVVHAMEDLPPFEDYSMEGRTYRYIRKEPLYPFGFGLSYTTFAYTSPVLSRTVIGPADGLTVRVTVKNTGDRAGDEVVQLYLTDLEASVALPGWSLRGFRRVHLEAGAETEVTFQLSPRQLALIDQDGRAMIEPGAFRVHLGGSQPDERSLALGGSPTVSAEFTIEGEVTEIPY